MKKFLAVILCFAMSVVLAGCTSDETNNNSTSPETTQSQPAGETQAQSASSAETKLGAIKDKMIDELDIKDPILLDNSRLLDQYGITEETIATQSSFIVTTGIFPAEIIMVEAVDKKAAEDVAEKLQTRLDNLKQQSQGYDADSYAIAQACEVETNGNYVALFFSEHCEKMVTIFEENL